MSLPLDDEPHFVFFEIEVLLQSCTYVGHLKTIKVWVMPDTRIRYMENTDSIFLKHQWLPELEYISILPKMRQIPRDKVALVYTAILFWRENPCKSAGIEVIHVLVNGDI